MKKWLSVIGVALSLSAIATTANGEPVTAAIVQRALQIAREAQKASASPTDAARAFNVKMEEEFGPDDRASLSQSQSLNVVLFTSMTLLRTAIATHIRKLEPLDAIVPTDSVGIMIEPTRIDAPDIVKVALLRNGQLVAPTTSSLAAQTLRTAMGATVVKHAGVVEFPSSAFAPDGTVHLSLIPDSGENIEVSFPPERLLLMTASREGLAVSLIKLTAADVEKRIGKPARIDGHRWTYATPVGSLAVYFDDANVVTDVQPKTFNLIVIKR